MKNLKHLYKNPAFWLVDQNRNKVSPFPGRYPTRWRVVFFEGIKTVFDYIGKPSPTIVAKIDALNKRKGTLVLAEFDRLGTFRQLMRGTPGIMALHYYNGIAAYLYYPWHSSIGEFHGPWRAPVHLKRVLLDGRSFAVYSPFEKMLPDQVEPLREWKTWLRRTNPLK